MFKKIGPGPAAFLLIGSFTVISPLLLCAQQGKVGINTKDPTETLDINGKIRIREGARKGYVLTADSMGSAYWSNPAALMPDHGTICITSLGAIGDGTTDNTAIIQQTIDSAALTGGSVCIPPGIFMISSTLNVPAGVMIKGSGRGSTLTGTPYNGSVIKYSGTSRAFEITGAGAGINNLVIYDDNNGGAAGALAILADGIIIESCDLANLLISGFATGTALSLHAFNSGGIAFCTFQDIRIRHAKTGIHLLEDPGSFVNSNTFNHGAISGGGFEHCLLAEGGNNNIFNQLVMEPYSSAKGHLTVTKGSITGHDIRIEGMNQPPQVPLIEFAPGTYGSVLTGIYGGGLTVDHGNNSIMLRSGKAIKPANTGTNLFMNPSFKGYSASLLPGWDLGGAGVVEVIDPYLFAERKVLKVTIQPGNTFILKPAASSLPVIMNDARYDHCNFGFYVKADRANSVLTTFNAPAGMASSTPHPGDGSWHFTGMYGFVDRTQPLSPCLRADNSTGSSDLVIYVTAPALSFGSSSPVIESQPITSDGGIIHGTLTTSVAVAPATLNMLLPKEGNVFIIKGTSAIAKINHQLADRFPRGAVITLLFDDAGATVVQNAYITLRSPFVSTVNSTVTLLSMGDGTWRELQRNL